MRRPLSCGFASVVALPLVAWFLATALLPIETYLLYVYCVLVVRAWTYEYGLNQMYVGGVFTGNRPPVFPPYVSRTGFKFLERLKSLLHDSLHDTCYTHDTCASGTLCMIHSSFIHLLCVFAVLAVSELSAALR